MELNLINGSKKDTVIQLAKVSQDIHDKNIRYILTDLTRHYMNRDKHLAKSNTKQKNFIVFKYTNRYMDDLNIPKLCNIPSYPCSNINLVPSYSYTKPIRNKIINYNSAILQPEDEIPDSCSCTSSPFINQDIGHIITGNLGIITDRKLRNLLCKGLTYRECNNPKKSDVIKSMEKDLNNHIIKISDKKSVLVSCFDLWKSEVLTNAKRQIDSIRNRRFNKPLLTDYDVVAKLKELHKSFVVVPTDKAANNVSIICKKYYHQCMQAELMSNVYEPVSTSEDDIIDKHVKELGSHNITIPNDNKKLPFIYSTAKQHKTPVGNRFIVSGKRCTTKKLSKVLLNVFQLVFKTLKYHCQYKCKFLKTKSYWIIDNSEDIHRDIKQLNNKKKASTIYSYDFTKLYTNIPHGMLKDNILYVIEEVFKIKEYPDFIKINMKSATWAKKKPDKTNVMYLNKDDVLSLLEYLLNNIYVKYRDNIFRQVIGVPMGTDCAPDLANLFLFAFEYKYIIGLIDVKSDDIKRFKFIYRYIDDLLVLNDNGHFDSAYTDIYPQALELKYTARSRTSATFFGYGHFDKQQYI